MKKQDINTQEPTKSKKYVSKQELGLIILELILSIPILITGIILIYLLK